MGLLGDDVCCRGRIVLGDVPRLPSAVPCCRGSTGLGGWGLPCARSRCPVVSTVGEGQELLVIPSVCHGFAGLVDCEGSPEARFRGVAEARGIWGPPCSIVFSRGFVVMGG